MYVVPAHVCYGTYRVLSRQSTSMPPLQGSSCLDCGVCKLESDLLLCDDCKVVWYCSSEHKDRHWRIHKESCRSIMDQTSKLVGKDDTLKDKFGVSISLPPDEFRTIMSTANASGMTDELRRWMWIADSLVGSLLRIPTVKAHEAALRYLRYLVWIRPKMIENDGLTPLIGVLLRLGREEECYDLLSWKLNVQDEYYKDPLAPLDTIARNTDPFLVAAFSCAEDSRTHAEHLIILQLLNIRRLIDLHSLRVVGESLSEDLSLSQCLVDTIKARTVGPSLSKRWDIIEHADLSEKIEYMVECIRGCHSVTRELYGDLIWCYVLYPEMILEADDMYHIYRNAYYHIWPFWRELPIAFDIIRHLEYIVTGTSTEDQLKDVYLSDLQYGFELRSQAFAYELDGSGYSLYL
ncbi:hypothetical protein GGR52DRAFT_583995 [Hypoxylon sp. FL1284]|nr:hypothetical protein GGR52DRAFT_583995 [Hypoxylon sp. FL1284]